MCFCASASFVASGGLALVGAATLQKSTRGERLIALVPLLFAVQQFIEGWQWLVVHPGIASLLLGYAFLLFAFLLWPFYIPLAVGQLESDPRRKNLLRWTAGSGVAVSLGLFGLMMTKPLTVQILSLGIDYHIEAPIGWFGVLMYIVAACGSLLISSHRWIRRFGYAALLSAAIAAWVYTQTFTSVWCFFAAVLSLAIYFFVADRAKKTATQKSRGRR